VESGKKDKGTGTITVLSSSGYRYVNYCVLPDFPVIGFSSVLYATW
jgi:hypothetical protein